MLCFVNNFNYQLTMNLWIEFKKEILTRGNWKNLSDYEKHNIKRAITEIVMTFVILPKLIELTAMGSTALDDDDNEYPIIKDDFSIVSN